MYNGKNGKDFQLLESGKVNYDVPKNTNNSTVVPAIPITAALEGMGVTLSSSFLAVTSAVAVGLVVARDTPRDEDRYVQVYRAMSKFEYDSTQGYLQDLKTSGEGPHVRYDISYINDANFIQKSGKYDYIVKYNISYESAAAFNMTPHVFYPGSGPGASVFNAARVTGLPYIKYEKGFSLGFPGPRATTLFNSAIIGKPEIAFKIGKK